MKTVDEVFYGCVSLPSIAIPNGVQHPSKYYFNIIIIYKICFIPIRISAMPDKIVALLPKLRLLKNPEI